MGLWMLPAKYLRFFTSFCTIIQISILLRHKQKPKCDSIEGKGCGTLLCTMPLLFLLLLLIQELQATVAWSKPSLRFCTRTARYGVNHRHHKSSQGNCSPFPLYFSRILVKEGIEEILHTWHTLRPLDTCPIHAVKYSTSHSLRLAQISRMQIFVKLA